MPRPCPASRWQGARLRNSFRYVIHRLAGNRSNNEPFQDVARMRRLGSILFTRIKIGAEQDGSPTWSAFVGYPLTQVNAYGTSPRRSSGRSKRPAGDLPLLF